MSDRLAVSATVSVLMMSIYVLFGSDAARMPMSPAGLQEPAALSTPALFNVPAPEISVAR